MRSIRIAVTANRVHVAYRQKSVALPVVLPPSPLTTCRVFLQNSHRLFEVGYVTKFGEIESFLLERVCIHFFHGKLYFADMFTVCVAKVSPVQNIVFRSWLLTSHSKGDLDAR